MFLFDFSHEIITFLSITIKVHLIYVNLTRKLWLIEALQALLILGM